MGPATWEVEVEELLEPKNSPPAWETYFTLHHKTNNNQTNKKTILFPESLHYFTFPSAVYENSSCSTSLSSLGLFNLIDVVWLRYFCGSFEN